MLFLKWVVAAVAAVGLLTSATDGRAQSSAKIDEQQAQMASMQAWLGDLAAWGQQYTDVISSRTETFGWMLESTEPLIDTLVEGNQKAVDEWAATWVKTARGRLDADLARYQALSTDMPTFPTDIPTTPEMRNRVAIMALMPDRTGALMIRTHQAGEEYIALVENTPADDVKALHRLGAGIYILMSANLEAENAMIDSLRGSPGQANYHFRGAIIETNKAVGEWLQHQKAVAFEEPADPAAVAARLSGHAQRVREEVTTAQRLTTVQIRSTANDPDLAGTPLQSMLLRILESLTQSLEVERLIAVEIDALASAVSGDDSDAGDAAITRIEGLSTRRAELDQARRADMARSGA